MSEDTYARLAREYVQAIEQGNRAREVRLEHQLDQLTADENARLARPDALIRAAVWYAKRGVAVFPCEPRGKRPLTAHGLKDASTDIATVVRWWRLNPDANIGAPTGGRFDVIDLDGPEAVRAIYGEGGPVLPPEIGHSCTSRQAGHHLFIEPTGAGNRAGIYPHVDYRGRSGYVILPPSIGANGVRYVWTRPLSFLVDS